ncbi:hypothetical protein T4B_6442 [Trichinella pseudospiralis]|uniref:Uncharacterized protein n=2 Tax=Trichinella pseudospiralis TaxID=6337 RepID=A0A0V0XJH0_TRIPS|nr:hypothetical protein T4E_10393 [Trichinella pseudospiralis]KRY68245.1 hypothetical protein T4A_8118 [Trichinella pseudospiralis]KRY89375.1 hypothetical protein T4D_15935 [Trichinella pseudospiralis]KRZ23638.1 hypothetical protein T4B_6442 [Trichinella pseudospiralis]KRZ35652.1 hypothetical protein T4C_8237 [Trichinella pseudospiralis]
MLELVNNIFSARKRNVQLVDENFHQLPEFQANNFAFKVDKSKIKIPKNQTKKTILQNTDVEFQRQMPARQEQPLNETISFSKFLNKLKQRPLGKQVRKSSGKHQLTTTAKDGK